MSFAAKTEDGKEVEASFSGLNPARGVQIGEYEFPMGEFCSMVMHFLGGGLFGWGDGRETPEPVNKALNYLFGLYEKKDGKWVRKNS